MKDRRKALRMGASERRRSPRHEVEVAGIVRSERGAAQGVVISDLSTDGCRFHAPGRHFAAGTGLTIGVGPVNLIHARVSWRIANIHGVSFDQPLRPAVLDHVRLFLSKGPALIAERPAA